MKRLRLGSRIRKVLQGSSRGFSLIEVVIAMLLLGIISVAVLGSLSYASTVLIVADRQATAESLARTQMEYVKNLPYDPEGGYTTEIPPEYGAGYSATIDVDELQEGLQRIRVTVDYYILRYNITTRGSELVPKQFILDGYKRNTEM